MVKRYAKNSVIVEATQWTGSNFDEVQEFIGTGNARFLRYMTDPPEVYIPTPEGVEYASIGDYIIKFTDDEIRTCGADFFKSNYEEVKE